MWVTGANRQRKRAVGFTLVELMAALAIAAILMAVAVPATLRMYQSMQYRQAVRDVVTLLATARYEAVNSGRVQDFIVNPREGFVALGATRHELPARMQLSARAARELSRDGIAVIRFYPEGGASGGGVDLVRPSGGGVKIEVDWLKGTVSQERYATQG